MARAGGSNSIHAARFPLEHTLSVGGKMTQSKVRPATRERNAWY